MVPWTQLREPFLRWMRTDLTSGFTHWILVTRQSIVKQLAITFLTIFCDVPLLKSSIWTFRYLPMLLKRDWRNSQSWPFTTKSAHDWMRSYHLAFKATACPLPAGIVFLCLFAVWWGQTCCASNSSELGQPFNAHVVWPTTVPSRE